MLCQLHAIEGNLFPNTPYFARHFYLKDHRTDVELQKKSVVCILENNFTKAWY